MTITQKQKNFLSQFECRDTAKQLRIQIGLQFAAARLKRSWTLEQAAKKMFDVHKFSFGPQVLQRIELGKHDLKLWDMVMLSKLYNVPLEITIK